MIEQYESINEFVLAGDFGFLRVDGPFSVEKEGALWTIKVPTAEDDYATPNRFTLSSLRDSDDKPAVLIADGQAVGGGLVDMAIEPDGEGELHIVVDQYARGRK
ncbi:hypothetical protein [Natrialba aegyptia]|uniref:Uncharacterized protein n=1 Tax=Natrialba aegyptia DSM 13077 TaxID=1227491 RepID=M0B438_9EURY|nr:hypothetical protein [Natrialba aegyptia]ELZ05307.1 hypothetical protein C480_10505 [Natrialba aegyptia DSM 13077]